LAAQGYTNVLEYVEGKKDWRAAQLPMERSEPVRAGAQVVGG